MIRSPRMIRLHRFCGGTFLTCPLLVGHVKNVPPQKLPNHARPFRCMISRAALVTTCLVLCAAGRAAVAEEKGLFDFKDGANLKAWTQYLPDNPKVPGAKEPPVEIEFARDSQASDRPCLKITYAGGKYPAIATPAPLEDWTPYKQFQAGVTVGRTCVVAFRVVRLDDKEHRGWVKLALLHKGHNVVTDLAPVLKGPTQFEILMYAPHKGETILVDDIRVATDVPRTATPYLGEHVAPGDNLRFYPKLEKIPVLGLDTPVANCAELAKRMADKSARPEDKPIERVEADFLALYQRLKKDHPPRSWRPSATGRRAAIRPRPRWSTPVGTAPASAPTARVPFIWRPCEAWPERTGWR